MIVTNQSFKCKVLNERSGKKNREPKTLLVHRVQKREIKTNIEKKTNYIPLTAIAPYDHIYIHTSPCAQNQETTTTKTKQIRNT